MKKIFFLLIVLIGVNVSFAHAQSIKEILAKAKQAAKDKTERKIEQKRDEGIDKILNAPEKAVGKKKNKKNRTAAGTDVEDAATSTSESSSESTSVPALGKPVNETVIITNIRCAAGKELLEELIREKAGVSNVSIDSKTGKVYVSLTGEYATKDEIEALIRNNGYESNGKKKIKGDNACN